MAKSKSTVFGSTLVIATLCSYSACRTIDPSDGTSDLATTSDAPSSEQASKPQSRTSLEFPRYAGFALLPDGSAKVAATLDLVAGRAVLKLALGGFDGTEYSSAFFSSATRDDGTHQWTFAGGPDGVALDLHESEASRLVGHVATGTGGPVLELQLLSLAPMADGHVAWPSSSLLFPMISIAGSVSGAYTGTCNEKKTELHLAATKWRAAGSIGSLAGYQIQGYLAQPDEVLCGDQALCIKEGYSGADLDISTGRLTLKSAGTERACSIKGDSLTCGPCTFAKISDTPASAASQHFAAMPRRFGSAASTEAASKMPLDQNEAPSPGQYYGYLHHESRDAYQLVALNFEAQISNEVAATAAVASAPVVPSQAAKGFAVASLYLGEGDSSEFTAYRLHSSTSSALLEGDGEAFAVMTSTSASAIKGVWYSKNFGRVGTFELQRDLVPELADQAKRTLPLSSAYRSDAWTFEIATSANVSEDATDFFPLKIYGWAQENLVTARRRTIEAGTYDPYTDTVAFRLDDGRVAFGRPTATGLSLAWPQRPRVGSPLEPMTEHAFQRIDLRAERQAGAAIGVSGFSR